MDRWAFRFLIRLYPPGHRREFGPEMLAHMEGRRRRAQERGRRGELAFWAALLGDATVAVPTAWLDEASALVRGGGTMNGGTIWRDAVFGVRGLVRRPGFAFMTILTLAVGIGAATALFSLVDPLLLRPLPYPAADRLVALWVRSPAGQTTKDWHAPALYMAYRERLHSLEDLTLFGGGQSIATAEDATPEFWNTIETTSGLTSLLGLKPSLGRMLQPGDDDPGAPLVGVLLHATWVGRFGGDPGVIGRTIQIGATRIEIVGVTEEEPRLTPEALPTVGAMSSVDLLVNLPLEPALVADDWRWNYNVMGRLTEGTTEAQLDAELADLSRAFIPEFEIDDPDFAAYAVPLMTEIVGRVRPLALALLGGVALLLIISCGNVSMLLIARGTLRRQEMGVRRAVGAGRRRIVAQLLSEGGVISAVAGALGVVVAWLSVRTFVRFGPEDVPRLAEVSLDGRVLVFALAVSAVTTVLAGLWPALRASRVDPGVALRGGGRGGSDRGQGIQARFSAGAFVAQAQIALSLVLLFCAGLLGRSYAAVVRDDPGFDGDGVLSMWVALGPDAPRGADRVGVVARLIDRVEALPGVEAAAVSNLIPLGSRVAWGGAWVEGSEDPATSEFRTVTPRYFDAMGIHVVKGRAFDETDMRSGAGTAIVDQAMVDRYWPDRDPLGLALGLGRDSMRVVGVVQSVRQFRMDEDSPRPFIYYPYGEAPASRFYLVARMSQASANPAPAVRGIIGALLPGAPIGNIQPVAALVDRALATRRAGAWLMGCFAVVAVFLALMGAYGLVSFRMAGARREIGLRLALGADRSEIHGLALRFGLFLGTVGVGVGAPLALVAGRLLQGQLFGVGGRDPVSLIGGGALVTVVAIGAALLPARRAARLDPVVVFRAE